MEKPKVFTTKQTFECQNTFIKGLQNVDNKNLHKIRAVVVGAGGGSKGAFYIFLWGAQTTNIDVCQWQISCRYNFVLKEPKVLLQNCVQQV